MGTKSPKTTEGDMLESVPPPATRSMVIASQGPLFGKQIASSGMVMNAWSEKERLFAFGADGPSPDSQTFTHNQEETMAKVLCVLYHDPTTGYGSQVRWRWLGPFERSS